MGEYLPSPLCSSTEVRTPVPQERAVDSPTPILFGQFSPHHHQTHYYSQQRLTKGQPTPTHTHSVNTYYTSFDCFQVAVIFLKDLSFLHISHSKQVPQKAFKLLYMPNRNDDPIPNLFLTKVPSQLKTLNTDAQEAE